MQITAAMVVDNDDAITECAIPHWQGAARGVVRVGPGHGTRRAMGSISHTFWCDHIYWKRTERRPLASTTLRR